MKIPELQVWSSGATLCQAAASCMVGVMREAVAQRGRCSLLLAGGNTPRLTYQALVNEPWYSQIPWKQLYLFWGDERCLPPGDPQRNETMARRALLNMVPVASSHVYPLGCAASPQAAAEAYAAILAAFFAGGPPRFDLVLLGLGTDGHVASLLPDSAALAEQQAWTAVAKRPEEPFSRVTLTLPLLNQARNVFFLVSGGDKAQVLRTALDGGPPMLPVHLIQPEDGRLLWLVDAAAARFLDRGDGR